MKMLRAENYFTVHGWMITRLKLKGTALTVYAVLYGFSQDGESEFRGSLDYIAEFAGISRPTVKRTLRELAEQGLIKKVERNMVDGTTNGWVCECNRGVGQNDPPGGWVKMIPPQTVEENKRKKEKEKDLNKNNRARARAHVRTQTYDDVMNDCGVDNQELRKALYRFIGHLSLNGVKVIDDRLYGIITSLDFAYRTDAEKIAAIDEAITNGYRRLPCEGE